MSEKKPKRERRVTARGVAVYPRVETPDTKFNKDGVYQIHLALEGKDADKFTAFIDDQMEQALLEAQKENPEKKAKMVITDPPYRPEYAKDSEGKDIEDEPTGRTLFRFKLNAVGTKRDKTTYTQRPVVLKADATPFLNSRLGGGSEVKIGYEVVPFSMLLQGSGGKIGCGVSLRLRVVQVLKYVEYQGGVNAASFGIEAEEGFTGISDETAAAGEAADEEEEEETTAAPAKKSGKREEF